MVLLEGGSCSRSAPLPWLPAAGGGGDPPHDGAVHPDPGPGRCRWRRSSWPGAPERAQGIAGARRRTQAPARAGRQQGPPWSCWRAAAAPDPLPLPWLPAAGGGGDPPHDGAGHPHPGPGQGREAAGPTVVLLEGGQLLPIRSPALAPRCPRRGPGTEPEPDEGPRAPARTGRQQGPPRSPGAGVKPSFPCLYEAGPCNGAAFINRE